MWEVKADRRHDLTRDPGRGAEERTNNHKKGPDYEMDIIIITKRDQIQIIGWP